MAARQRSRKRLTADADVVIRAALTAIYTKDGDRFTGYVVELMGISAVGRTLDETRERLESAARGYLEFNRESIRRRMQASSVEARTETFIVEI